MTYPLDIGRESCSSSVKQGVGLFYLQVSLFYLRLVFVAYGQLAWSFLLTAENRFGLSCLR